MRRFFEKGETYKMRFNQIHTIQLLANETVLMLRQYEDNVSIGEPTTTFCVGDAPSLTGLYSKFTIDEIVSRLIKFEERTGVTVDSLT